MNKRYTEEQIIGFLREADACLPIKERRRKHGFIEASCYCRKAKFSGIECRATEAANEAPNVSTIFRAVYKALDLTMINEPAEERLHTLRGGCFVPAVGNEGRRNLCIGSKSPARTAPSRRAAS